MEEEMKTRIVYYFIGIVISALALTSVASLSSYAHNTDQALTATHAQMDSLQKDYDQLKAEHEALAKDYEQAKSDLSTANSNLAAANDKVSALDGELKTAQEQNGKLEQIIKIARLNMSVLVGLFDDSTTLQEMDDRIAATGNSEMSSNWQSVSDENSLGGFIFYLVHTVWASMN
jgi:chromosome segregation ATPase